MNYLYLYLILAGCLIDLSIAAPNLNRIKEAADYILTCIYDNAIADTYDKEWLMPYWSSFACFGLARAATLLNNKTYSDVCWNWLDWQQSHQDPTTGYVFDYDRDSSIPNDPWHSTGDMDSTDSYASWFILALYDTYTSDPDLTQLRAHELGVKRSVTAIEGTLDNGLTWAKPGWMEKYLMDNVETVLGLQACVALAPLLTDPTLQARCQNLVTLISNATKSILWRGDMSDGHWAVFVDDSGEFMEFNWTNLYADAITQMWPLAFGLVSSSDSRAAILADKFTTKHPNWCKPLEYDYIRTINDIPEYIQVGWEMTPAGWGLLSLGRYSEAATAATNLYNAAVSTDWEYPFTSGTAGELIVLEVGNPVEIVPFVSDSSSINSHKPGSNSGNNDNNDKTDVSNQNSFIPIFIITTLFLFLF